MLTQKEVQIQPHQPGQTALHEFGPRGLLAGFPSIDARLGKAKFAHGWGSRPKPLSCRALWMPASRVGQ